MAWLAQRGRWLSCSVGTVITEAIHSHVLKIPASPWTPAVETDGEVRDGAWGAELAGDVQDDRPKGIAADRPQGTVASRRLRWRITAADGMRLTCFATNTRKIPIAELELRHRRRARAEDRIRGGDSPPGGTGSASGSFWKMDATWIQGPLSLWVTSGRWRSERA